MKKNQGFTLIELMVVIAIIGILAAIAVPQFSAYRKRAFASEGRSLCKPVLQDIIDYYEHTGRMPENNHQAGLAEPELIKGKYVDTISVQNGIVTVLFNEVREELHEEYQLLKPVINEENPTGPVVWELESGKKSEMKNTAKEDEAS